MIQLTAGRFTPEAVRLHFDRLAPEYDRWKRRNRYYYAQVKGYYRKAVAPGAAVLELGTATGEILAGCAPARGVGIDISREMVERARSKYPQYEFRVADAGDFRTDEKFDYVIMCDLLEHLADIPQAIRCAVGALAPGGQLICTTINPLYGPAMELLERFRLKMPEGPHVLASGRDVESSCRSNGLKPVVREWFLCVPVDIPLFSASLNLIVPRIPLVRRLCCVQALRMKKDEGRRLA